MEMIRGARRILKTQTKEDIEEVERVREERRTKRRNDPSAVRAKQGEFEIGVNIPMRRMMTPKCGVGPQEHALGQALLYHMESYKELTCEFLASMRYHMYEEEDRADLDQGLGWITFLAKGEKRMVTFRQLEILFGFNYGEGTKWNFKEKELQRVWATIADGVYSSSRSKAAQIRSPVLRYVHKALANTFFARKATGTINEGELKFLDMGIKPFSHAQAMARGSGEIDLTQGT
ncbi:unnamed protein product [Microthlaspi erraticum]|uniref:Arabidopsis retrotransposon Orf1 C-terminal domain-containing protein n=5 Tax=Microthlaspi erraticum TaxID=1685480 RepID=A0A6D2HTS7_9BRAS|nr:unnamed protein product [Microthlaspi erraticum]